MSQQSPEKPSPLLNSEKVPLTKPHLDIGDLRREFDQLARHFNGLNKSIRRLDKKLKEAV